MSIKISESISPSNLFRLIGQKDYVFEITFKKDSELYIRLGSNILSRLEYSKQERDLFENSDDSFIDTYSKGIIKINIISLYLTANEKMKYRLEGINCFEIDKINFIPYSTVTEPNIEGIKELPNVIRIPYESKSKLEYENIFCALYSRLINDNEPLIFDEKMEYIGIDSAFHEGSTSSKLLIALNLTIDDIQRNSLFWKSYYETKQKMSGLNDEEKKDYEDHRTAIWYKKLQIFFNEIMKGGKVIKDDPEFNRKVDFLYKEIEKFKTARFGFGFPLIYWDLESYLHIILRHIKKTKISEKNLLKSNIPYKTGDLKTLIGSILDLLKDEIEEHFKTKAGKKFFRSGKWAVYFNGDYFSIDIDVDGRIITFYKN